MRRISEFKQEIGKQVWVSSVKIIHNYEVQSSRASLVKFVFNLNSHRSSSHYFLYVFGDLLEIHALSLNTYIKYLQISDLYEFSLTYLPHTFISSKLSLEKWNGHTTRTT